MLFYVFRSCCPSLLGVSSSIKSEDRIVSPRGPAVKHLPAVLVLAKDKLTHRCRQRERWEGLLCVPVEAPHQGLPHPGHGEHPEADLLQLVEDQARRVVHMVLCKIVPQHGSFPGSQVIHDSWVGVFISDIGWTGLLEQSSQESKLAGIDCTATHNLKH